MDRQEQAESAEAGYTNKHYGKPNAARNAMNANVQTFLHRVGSVLAVAGLALVLQRLYAQHDTLQAVHFSKLQYLSIAGLAMIYGLSG